MLTPRAALTIALLCLGASAAHAEADHAGIARAALEQYIRPGYTDLAESAEALSQSVGALCEQPSATALKGAQTAFAATVAAWSKIEPIRFGPVAEADRYERIFYWPDPKGLGGRQVHEALAKQDQGVTDSKALAGKSVALQGLPALEDLLYGDGAEALVKGAGPAAFRCRFAASIAANVAAMTKEIEQGWQKGAPYTKAYLEPGPGEEDTAGLPSGLRAHDVGHRQHLRARLPRKPHGRQRIGGLSRLAYRDTETIGADHGIPVAELRRHLNFHRDAGPPLERVLAHQAGVVRGAAGDDDHLLDVPDGVRSEAKPLKNDAPVRARPLGEGVGQRGGLLVDLLEHERLVARFLRGFLVPVDDQDLPLHHHAVDVEDLGARPGDDDHIPVLGEDHRAGLGQEGGDGRSQEVLTFAQAHHERGLFAHPHDHVRLVHRYGAIGEVPLHLPVGLNDRLPQRPLVSPLDEVSDDFGVGLRGELVALLLELCP